MGVVKGISYDKFPKQRESVGKEIDVCFNYNANKFLKAIIVRDDAVEPLVTIFMLEDGRFILSTECHYRYIDNHMHEDVSRVEMERIYGQKIN